MTDLERPTARAGIISFLLHRQFGPEKPEPTTKPIPNDAGYLPLPSPRPTVMAHARAQYDRMSDVQLTELAVKARQEDEEKAAAKREQEENSLFFNQPRAFADLDYWGKMAIWSLDEGVALSLGRSPLTVNWQEIDGYDEKYVSGAMLQSPFLREYRRRHELVRRANLAHELREPIRPEEFLTWALRVFDSVPSKLIERVSSMGKDVADVKVLQARVAELEKRSQETVTLPPKWPWGERETKALNLLAQAAQKFWGLYDPSEPSTAPTNDQVSDWLETKGLSKNIAQAMATILRADNIGPGPRK